MPVKFVLKSKVPVKLWSDAASVESAALDQLRNIASLPFVYKHVAVMPDVHLGKGATVGSIIATKGAVIPAAVGVDIGCGMAAVKLKDFKIQDFEGKLSALRHSIERSIPVGRFGNKNVESEVTHWSGWSKFSALTPKALSLRSRALEQMGSLGGGNHFIEVCYDADGSAWIMLHSGSRNIGKSVAEIHINSAKSLIAKMMISLPDPDLAYFVCETPEFDNYMRDLLWCQDYAAENRRRILSKVINDVSCLFSCAVGKELEINCHHNFAVRENHFGENVIVTRKGAVRARKGDLGIIPGSMGTKSYIVRGLGNEESFQSCSHGAGRRMSRSQAKREFTLDDLAKQTEGVECRKDFGIIDEIPGAYKDINEVIANQADLVEVVAELKQVLCVKG